MHIYVHISVFTYIYICIRNPNAVSVLSRKIGRYFAILKFRKYLEKSFEARPSCVSIHSSARRLFRRLFKAIKIVERNSTLSGSYCNRRRPTRNQGRRCWHPLDQISRSNGYVPRRTPRLHNHGDWQMVQRRLPKIYQKTGRTQVYHRGC